MERYRADPALASYYQELEEKHSIKAYWFRDGNYELPQRYPSNLRDYIEVLPRYIQQPALVDEFKLNTDRINFWMHYIGDGRGRSDKFNIYHHNRLRLNCINSLLINLELIKQENLINKSEMKLVNNAFDYINAHQMNLPAMGDGYKKNVTLSDVDMITGHIFNVCWALAEI